MSTKEIVVRSPPSENCECNDGMERQLFRVTKSKWARLGKELNQIKYPSEERDYSSGAHGCLISIHWQDLYTRCRIVEDKPSKSQIKLVKSLQDTEFLDGLQDFIRKNKLKTLEEEKEESKKSKKKTLDYSIVAKTPP